MDYYDKINKRLKDLKDDIEGYKNEIPILKRQGYDDYVKKTTIMIQVLNKIADDLEEQIKQ